MNIICLEEEAFFLLLEQAIQRILKNQEIKEDKWISAREAMRLLRISSKTTLQKLRDTGEIRFSQDQKRILYDRDSICAYLERKAKNTF